MAVDVVVVLLRRILGTEVRSRCVRFVQDFVAEVEVILGLCYERRLIKVRGIDR
jgi:hypothetical protein